MIDQLTEIFMRFGTWGLFGLAFLDSIILPLPPFFLQIAMSFLNPSYAMIYATVAFIGSIAGAPVGYLMGKVLGKPILNKILPQKWISVATDKFAKDGDAAVLVGSFTPIPFKVFTILSGVFGFSFMKLILYAILGRGIKFFGIGLLFYWYGEYAKTLLEQYLDISLLGVAAVLAVGWLAFKLVRSRKR
ncbi:YqaA family protein [Brevibacillus sp. B_LB10_24]|uniref:YqaA family protein n=1 Tax=Brevibacillus sp. B_LB10_24 TaxID=3380645 RepID=UPI0038BA185A